MDSLLIRICEELKQNADPEIQKSSQRVFKEGILCYAMKTKTAATIGKNTGKMQKTGDLCPL